MNQQPNPNSTQVGFGASKMSKSSMIVAPYLKSGNKHTTIADLTATEGFMRKNRFKEFRQKVFD
jgi:hypothetical protein